MAGQFIPARPRPWYRYPITQGFNPPTEKGEDIATPFHTPITALRGGRVVQAVYQPWGGEVDILTSLPGIGPVIEYFLHLDRITVHSGEDVSASGTVGLSGGQTSGGEHPTDPRYSTGLHTEVGFLRGSTPFSQGGSPTLDPAPLVAAGPTGGGGLDLNPLDLPKGIADAIGRLPSQAADTISQRLFGSGFIIRAGLVLFGLLLVVVGLLVTFQHQTEEAAGTVAGAAAKAA